MAVMGRWWTYAAIVLFWVAAIAAVVIVLADDRTDAMVVHDALRATMTADDFAARIESALAADDIETADVYAETATFAGYSLPPEVHAELNEAHGIWQSTWRESTSFATGFVTGETDDLASFGGAVASDLTVVGDVRDIALEGSAMVAGEPYDEFILILSGVGLGITTATWATGGAALPVRVGASVTKAAKRTGRLAAPLLDDMVGMARQAIDMPRLKTDLAGIDATDIAGLRRVAGKHLETARHSRLVATLDEVGDIASRLGPAETLRILPHIESAAEIGGVAAMAKVLGKKTRAVIELTGKTSLRLFKRGWPLMRILVAALYGVLASIPGWIAWRITRRLARFTYLRLMRPAAV
ncbi:MAG: hypothetical protein AAF563_19845 [Pseudomonadota bacterium]